MRLFPVLLAGLTLALTLGVTLAAPSPPAGETGIVKDRAGFIPYRKYAPLPGTTVGVLVHDVKSVMAQEGRSGPPDAMGLSRDAGSYRWIYVPTQANPLITNLMVKVGEKGDRTRNYPSLTMASPTSLAAWGLEAQHALVEVEVNDGDGAPPDEGFVATKMRRLDGTRDYPLVVSKVVAELRKKYATALEGRKKKIDEAMEQEGKKALGGRQFTGPRQSEDLVYLTWQSEARRLAVHLRTRVSDGAYQTIRGGGNLDGPAVPPLPPGRGRGRGPALAFFPPPPPREFEVQVGTTVTVELGTLYEVDRGGKLVRTLELPIQATSSSTAPPPGGRPRN